MLGRFKHILQKNLLLKITSINSIAVGIQIIAGLITSKVIAIYLGERGMALMGYLRDFMNTSQSAATLGMRQGVVKYVAEFSNQKKKLSQVLSTTYYLGFFSTMIAATVLYFGASYWNEVVFKGAYDFEYIFRYLAISLPFFTLNIFCVSIINGFSKYKVVVRLNIITQIIGLFVTVLLIWKFGIDGALQAMVYTPALALLITGVMIYNRRSFINLIKATKIRGKFVKGLASYTGMAIFSAMLLPVVSIAIREEIVTVDGIENAGYWDAMTRISGYYFKFITTLLALYILPQLAKAQTASAFRKEIFGFYKTVLPLFAAGLMLIFLFKSLIVQIVLTEDFLGMLPIFKWQLLGDFFKVASIVVAYQFLARNMFWHFIITEALSIGIIYVTSVYFIKEYGFVGASMGHFMSYVIYLCVVLFIFRKPLFSKI